MEKIINFLKSNVKVIIVIVILLIFLILYLTKAEFRQKTVYTVVNGDIEHSVEANLYVIKDETVIDYDTTQAITSIVEQGKRARENEVIATYQNSSYEEYQREIEQIDKQIQTLVKDLPETYSADIVNIDNKILDYSNEIQGTTSYLKMQEYKVKLDELAYRKINVLANASPDSSAIRDLVNQRENLENLSKTSENTILTPISGVVTYKIDSLENTYSFNDIENYTASDFDKLIASYDNNNSSEFGIKVVDNFKTYLLVKSQTGENDEYIKQGNSYRIRISDLENVTITAVLVRNITQDNYNYSLFEIDNEVDSLVDYRKLSCEVIWDVESGMAVPLNAVYKDETQEYNYVLLVYGTDYIRVPVSIIAQSDSIAIVENVDNEEYEKYNLDSTFKLEVYDELVIEEK